MTSSFCYHVGGCLQADAPNYVVRQADRDLQAALQAREFGYVFSSRQMGKSSLLIRMKQQLQATGAACAYLDMTRLGTTGLTQTQWYAGVVMSLLQSLGLSQRLQFHDWWQAHAELTLVQRLNHLVETVLLPEETGPPLYIFIDEIDSLLSLEFSTDDFFAWMRACYNQRSHDPRYRRLTFALFGVTTPTDLMADKQRTPFNVGRAIPLTGFTLAESAPLQAGLEPWVDHPSAVLKSILDWTAGQPFLTQKLCDLAVQTAQQAEMQPLSLSSGMAELWVEELVRSRILDHWEAQDEPIHLRTIRDHLFWHQNRTGRILGIYQALLQGQTIPTDDSREQVDLLLSGLLVRQGNRLAIKNRIYQEVFTEPWVERQLQRLRPYAAALTGWVTRDRQDPTYLLQGQTLQQAEQWAQGKSLSDLDYQFLAASQDAERQRIQHLLDAKAESERFFRQLAEAVPQIVWIVEPDGNLSYSNQQGKDFSGLPLEALQGQQRMNVVHPDDRPGSRAAWENAHATGEPYEVQLRMRDAEGNYRWFLNRAVPIRDAQGQVMKWFGTSTDLDDVKRVEEAKRLQEVEARLVEQEKRLQQEQRARRLQRSLLGSVSLALLVSTLLGSFAFWEKRQSALREVAAITNASEAQFASGNRLDALVAAMQAQTRLNQLSQAPASLATQVEADLRRASFQVVERNRFGTDAGIVLGTAVNAEGRIASAHLSGAIALWHPDGRLIQVLTGHEGEVMDVAFSPDGKILISTGRDGTVRWWTADGTPIKTVNAHQNRGMAVDVSPDWQWIASASEDQTVKLWSRDGQLQQTFRGHDDFVWDVAFSPDSQTLASASWDNTLKLWSMNGQRLQTFANRQVSEKGENRLVSVTFSPNGQTIATGDWYGDVIWWQRDGTWLRTQSEHDNAVISLAFSPDGQTLASSSWDDTIKFWNTEGNLIKTLAGHATGTWEVQFAGDNQRLISGGGDSLLRLWQLQPESLTVLRGHQASVWGVAWTPDGHIVSASADGTLKQWNAQNHLQHSITVERGESWTVAVSPNDGAIAAVHNDGSLTLWDGAGNLRQTVLAHEDVAFDVAYNANGQAIATTGWDGAIRLWSDDGTAQQTLIADQQRLNAVAFSPDDQWLAAVGDDQILRLWQRQASGQFVIPPQIELTADTENLLDVAFSPDSQYVATAGEGGLVKLWTLAGEPVKTLEGHTARVNAIAFIPSNSGLPTDWGTVLVTASWDKSIKLWGLDGTLRLTLEGHEERVLDVDFAPATATHGPMLASSGIDDVVIVWPLDQLLNPDQVMAAGCTWVQDYLATHPEVATQVNICQKP
ncbi:AAA-like domain-containing protein [Leptolyngbya iicbica]|uniref:PAS domain S-box protein n=2 Tax=Cyanophyceae TaxID=3028117 RepID=A0A4Q7E1W7_9CYAN|nr:AAA-like domain-containing protein [Leptolyngbya sp. LK]RZM75412.1 PAS domain S-box protein [Leptolyngbya sp. LK]